MALSSRQGKRGLFALQAVDYLLCSVIALCMCYTVQGGFNVSDELHGNIALDAAVCLCLQGLLFAGAFGRMRKLHAGLAYAVLSLLACGLAVVVSPLPDPVADVPENLFVTVAVFAVVNAVCHVLARTHAGCLALFGIGAFTCGYMQFLYTTNMLAATVAFLLAAGMMLAYRSYCATLAAAGAAAPVLFGKASAAGILLPFAAFAAAALVVFGIIMPLDPPHAELKLFDEYLAYEEDRVKTGIDYDEDAATVLTSSSVDDSLELRTTTDKKVEQQAAQSTAPSTSRRDSARDYLSGDYSDVDISGLAGRARALALTLPFPWQLLVLGLLAAFVFLLTVPRFLVHRLRLRRIAAKAPGEQVVLLYGFFLSRFEKLGMAKPEAMTPVEYANMFRARLAPFVGAQAAGTFDHLTALLVQKKYAGAEPDGEDVQCMHWLYREFYARCRKRLGWFGYGFRHLTL